MKLRLRHNSIRLRLTRSEVRELASAGSVSEAIEFGGGSRFTYSIDTADEGPVSAAANANGIAVSIPRELTVEWAETDRVGIEADQSTGAAPLRILIEKDFACLEPRAEDTDAFPHPMAKCAT